MQERPTSIRGRPTSRAAWRPSHSRKAKRPTPPVPHAGTWSGVNPQETFPSGSSDVEIVVNDDATGWVVFGDSSLGTTDQDILHISQEYTRTEGTFELEYRIVEGYAYRIENARLDGPLLKFDLGSNDACDNRLELHPYQALLESDGSLTLYGYDDHDEDREGRLTRETEP